MKMTLEVLELTKNLKVSEIDERIETLSRELDLLRLLRQIAMIQEEVQYIGDEPKRTSVILNIDPPPASVSSMFLSRSSLIELESQDETEILGKSYVPPANGHSVDSLQTDHGESKSSSNGMHGMAPWSIAGRVHALLSTQGQKSAKELVIAIDGNQKGVYAALKYWKGKLFENVSRGVWKALPLEQLSQKAGKEHQPRRGKKKSVPDADTLAGRIHSFLLKEGPTELRGIIRAFGASSEEMIRRVIKKWKGRVFETTAHGVWKAIPLDAPLPKSEGHFIPSILPDEEAEAVLPHDEYQDDDFLDEEEVQEGQEQEAEEPLNGDAFRIRAYLQRNQPAKPMIIAADLNIPIGQVTVLLNKYKCFTMNGNGWVLKKTRQTN